MVVEESEPGRPSSVVLHGERSLARTDVAGRVLNWSTTMISLLLAERGRFWVEQVRSIVPGLAFRFRAFISVIG